MITMEMVEVLKALRCSDEYCPKGTCEQRILRELWKDRPRSTNVNSTMVVLFSDFFQVYWCSHRLRHLERRLCRLRGSSAREHVFHLPSAFNSGAVDNQWCFGAFGLDV